MWLFGEVLTSTWSSAVKLSSPAFTGFAGLAGRETVASDSRRGSKWALYNERHPAVAVLALSEE